MSILDKIKRLKDGLASETDPDLILSTRAIISGMTNFYFNLDSARPKKLAEKRLNDHCSTCEHNVEDPIEDMKVIDKEIPDLSGRMCKHCGGCVLSFKLRQSLKKCELWHE